MGCLVTRRSYAKAEIALWIWGLGQGTEETKESGKFWKRRGDLSGRVGGKQTKEGTLSQLLKSFQWVGKSEAEEAFQPMSRAKLKQSRCPREKKGPRGELGGEVLYQARS